MREMNTKSDLVLLTIHYNTASANNGVKPYQVSYLVPAELVLKYLRRRVRARHKEKHFTEVSKLPK